MTRLPIVAAVLAVLAIAGCELTPNTIERSADVDAYLTRKAYASACVGLAMDHDDSLREYTAQRLASHAHVRAATDCLCKELYDTQAHKVDLSIAKGLVGTRRDDLAACLAPALEDPAIPQRDRPDVVAALAGIDAPGSWSPLEALAKSDPDAGVRAHAARALRQSSSALDTLVSLLSSDPEPVVRQAAAEALSGHKGREAVSAVLVRERAVRAFHGTKRVKALDCIQQRMNKYEESGNVRKAILEALGASPNDRAAKMLCDNIGPWLRLYVKDEIADRIPGANIVEFQNNRDWERSYECVAKALQRGGYSCYARNHLGHWMNELGGKASTPWCPGMPRN